MRARLSIVAALAVLVAAGGLTGCKPTSDAVWNYHPLTVKGGYIPLVGDFAGDGSTDILWFGRGTNPDSLWIGRRGARGADAFEKRSVRMDGVHDGPVVGDFAGDERDDILWYGHGSLMLLWVADDTPSGFRTEDPFHRAGGPTPPLVLHDDRPDAKDAVFIDRYGTYTFADDGSGTWTYDYTYPTKAYNATVGDFDGDGLDDILWWAHGPDYYWTMDADGHPTSAPASVPDGAADAQVVRRDGNEGILWWRDGRGVDEYWRGPGPAFSRHGLVQTDVTGRVSPAGLDGAVVTSDDDLEILFIDDDDPALYELSPSRRDMGAGQTPLAGDFDGDGGVDLFWYGYETTPDEIWYLRVEAGATASGLLPTA